MDTVRIFALGGLDEDGKNLYVVEVNQDIFVIEAGIKYPDIEQLGIEMIIPDMKYLVENKDRVRGIFITHAHDDAMAALPYLLKLANIPIYTTPLSAVMIEEMLKKANIKDVKIHRIKRNGKLAIGKVNIRTFGLTHSIADAFGLAIETDQGAIVYAGEYIIDLNARNAAFSCDISEFAEIGKKGVLALMVESVYAEKPGFTAPNHRITDYIENAIEDAQGRIFITLYEQNLYRLIEVIELANKYKKKIYFNNENQRNLLRQVEKLGYYHVPAGLELSAEKFTNDFTNVIIIVSASGPNVFRVMHRITTAEDTKIELHVDDTVIIGSPVVPGTELEAGQMENELYKEGVHVVTLDRKKILSLHASSEDIKMLLFLLKPKYFIPVHGEYRQMVVNANIALDSGYFADRIVVLDNGQVALFEDKLLKNTSTILPLEDLMIDGNESLDISGMVLKDRVSLSTDGAIIVGVVVNYATKEVIGGPDVQSRGFIYLKDADYIVKEIGNMVERIIIDAVAAGKYENMAVRMEAKDKITRYVYKETGKHPMILPVIVEINISD
jgi:ribonuclease J